MVDDTYINWRINVMAVKPADLTAFIAIDDFALHPTDTCEVLPIPEGNTSTSPGTTITSAVPPDEDVFCTFQENLCDFEVEGTEDFKFERKKGSEVDLIGEDRHGNADGIFLIAQSGDGTSDLVFTYVISPYFDGEKYQNECFNFWFYVDGFLVSKVFTR